MFLLKINLRRSKRSHSSPQQHQRTSLHLHHTYWNRLNWWRLLRWWPMQLKINKIQNTWKKDINKLLFSVYSRFIRYTAHFILFVFILFCFPNSVPSHIVVAFVSAAAWCIVVVFAEWRNVKKIVSKCTSKRTFIMTFFSQHKLFIKFFYFSFRSAFSSNTNWLRELGWRGALLLGCFVVISLSPLS